MEVLFENVYKRDKALAKEFYSYCFLRRPIYMVLYTIYLALFAFSIVMELQWGISSNIVIVGVPIYFVLKWLQYRSCVKAMLKRDAELFGAEPLITAQITDEKIILLTEKGIVNEVEFCNIRKAVTTNNLILIFTKARIVFILRRGGFIKGNEEQLLSFLKSKGIKMK